jgi:hypothetical protein
LQEDASFHEHQFSWIAGALRGSHPEQLMRCVTVCGEIVRLVGQRFLLLGFGSVVLAAAAGQVQAQIVFDNGPTDDTRTAWTAWSASGPVWTIYDDFVLTQDTTITAIQYDIFRDPTLSGYINTTVSILDGFEEGDPVIPQFDDVATETGNGTFNIREGYTHDITGLSITLPAGTYVLGVSINLSGDPGEHASIGSGPGSVDTIGDGLVQNNYQRYDHMSFRLYGTADTTPPEVSCAVDTDLLWAPNHNLVDVGFSFEVVDDQDLDPNIEVLVFSDEDDEEPTGSGNHSPDSKDDGESLRLRSERRGDSDGRVYLIVVIATDAEGNVGLDCCTVVVPRSNSKKNRADVYDQAEAAELFCLGFGEAPPGFVEVGDGAIIGPKQ